MIESTLMNNSIAESYDSMPYESHSFIDSSPENLCAITHLFGLEGVDTTKCKVLELGCASGGNIIPLACRNPKSEYVGVDLSSVQIKLGQKKIADLKLANVEIKHMSITDIDVNFGKFDYIIVHGVYSWVPPNVQEHILKICSQNLTPKGLALISYNTYPGWKVKEILRDAMILRGASHQDPYKKLSHARGMVNFLQEMTAPKSVMRTLIDSEIDLIRNAAPHYLNHEFLEEYNLPCYFKDFIAKAEQHNLAYVAEAEPHTMFVSNLGQQVAAPLLNECGNSQIMLEQYMDFLKNRPFRQTILTHKKQAAKLNYKIGHDVIKEFEFFGRFASAEKIDLDYIPTQFTSTKGSVFTISQPIEKAALLTINEAAPASLNFRQILEGAQKRLGSKLPIHADVIVSMLEQFIIQGLIRFRFSGTKIATQLSEKPIADNLVRYDAEHQPQVGTSNVWHESVRLELIQQHILPKLDGKHDQEKLLKHLIDLSNKNIVQFSRHGIVLKDAAEVKEAAQEHLKHALELCRNQALLIG
jgi:methyltransferase-like protein/2-polyprenyl-3-methyl-5-hydroxy-6-metoxy-1,4-benzoquinol methylase